MESKNKTLKNRVFLAWLIITSFVAWQWNYSERYVFDILQYSIYWIFTGVILIIPFIFIYKFLKSKETEE